MFSVSSPGFTQLASCAPKGILERKTSNALCWKALCALASVVWLCITHDLNVCRLVRCKPMPRYGQAEGGLPLLRVHRTTSSSGAVTDSRGCAVTDNRGCAVTDS